jgi:hypothetical protein
LSLLDFKTFSQLLKDKVTHLRISWDVLGFYAPDGRVYPFGTDTKVLSTVFETLVEPIIISIAEEYDYTIQRAEQTIYPDFTLTPKNEKQNHIAIDIKTTYRRFKKDGQMREFRYTLGSYTSFLRVPGAKKNILHPYQEYTGHWVIGFLYTRRERATLQSFYHLDDTAHLPCPYQDVAYFVQEKYKIVGLTPASGNTTNIGSFPTADIEDLRQGKGPFAAYGKDICDDYWRFYPRESSKRAYTTVEEFLDWRQKFPE